tara:strand:- start:2133 stop:3047 length:915 start_codon:yes stop_codon:yes gene_type:complete
MTQRRVLITGGEGFVGSNLIEYLLKNTNYKIYSISRNLIKKYQSDRFVSIAHDMLKEFNDIHVLQLKDIDYIVHLAGASCVGNSFLNPLKTIKDNIILTSNFLEFARLNMLKLKKILFLSTAESFGPSWKNNKFKEEDCYSPHSPYAATKAAISEICIGYNKSYNLPVIVIHVMNIYGKNQSENKFIPKIIKMIQEEKTIVLHANDGPDVRNYLHIDDICDAITYLLINGRSGEKYNLISDAYTNNLEISSIIAKIMNKKLKYNLVSSDRHHTLTLLDGKKIRDLGWSSSIPLQKGLEMVINEE